MTYRVSLNSIVENLERYCKHVDSLCACYKAEQARERFAEDAGHIYRWIHSADKEKLETRY